MAIIISTSNITGLLSALQTSVSALSKTVDDIVVTQNQQTARLAAIKSELDAVKAEADAIQPDRAAIMQALSTLSTQFDQLLAVLTGATTMKADTAHAVYVPKGTPA